MPYNYPRSYTLCIHAVRVTCAAESTSVIAEEICEVVSFPVKWSHVCTSAIKPYVSGPIPAVPAVATVHRTPVGPPGPAVEPVCQGNPETDFWFKDCNRCRCLNGAAACSRRLCRPGVSSCGQSLLTLKTLPTVLLCLFVSVHVFRDLCLWTLRKE